MTQQPKAPLTPEQIRVTGWGDLAATIPYQWGYHPHDSLVAVTMISAGGDRAGRQRREVGSMARFDLPRATDLHPWAAQVAQTLTRQHAAEVALFTFETTVTAATGATALARAAARARAAGVAVVASSRVRDGRVCLNDRRWVPLPAPEQVPGVTALIAQGMLPLGAREDLQALLLDVTGGRPLVQQHLTEVAVSFDPTDPADQKRTMRAWQLTISDDPRDKHPEARALACLAVGLADPHLRDAAIAWCVPDLARVGPTDLAVARLRRHAPPPGRGRGPLHRAVTVAAQVPDSHRAPVLTAVAAVAWQWGEGTLASVCVEEALRLDPDHRLAVLLEQLLQHGVDPRIGSRAASPTGSPGPV